MSFDFNHAGVEVRAASNFAGVEADAAHGHQIQEADQHGRQTSEADNPASSRHEFIEGVVTVRQSRQAACIVKCLLDPVQSLMSLKR